MCTPSRAAPRAATVKRAFVVHGEPDSAEALAEGLTGLGYGRVYVPKRGERHEL